MIKGEHYTNGFLTKIWNNLIYSQNSISQKLEDDPNYTIWISIIPNALDVGGTRWMFKILLYKVNSKNNLDDYPLDIDLFIEMESEYYCTTIDDLLLYLVEKNINNSNFDASWKVDAPF
jgi:hypothetical protein